MTRDGGFTLVELLMAALTAALLFAGFSMSFHGARAVWARTMHGLADLSQQRAMLDHLAQDLANTMVLPREDTAEPPFRFEAQRLQLYTVQPPHTEDRLGRLVRVEYVVEETTDGNALIRHVRPFHSATTFHATQRLLVGVEGVSFRYGSREQDLPAGIRWSVVWEDEETMPRYVEVSVQSSGRALIRHLLHVSAGT